MKFLAELKKIGIDKSQSYKDDDFILKGIWSINHIYRPNVYERLLTYSMVLAQTIGQGCCYIEYGQAKDDTQYLGMDTREFDPDNLALKIAVLDAMFTAFDKKPIETYTFLGSSSEKAINRASIVTKEVLRELKRSGGTKVLNVGVMGNFIQQLVDIGVDVLGSDYDPELIQEGINNTKVIDGKNTLDLIQDTDVVLSTGMTLWTQTLPDIIKTVQKYNKRLILFAATGAHFAEEYCNHFGVDVVISEPQPQYIFQGHSTINIYRRK